MINIDKALEVLGLPNEMEAFNGQVQTRTVRTITIYENNDFTSGKQVITYSVEFNEAAPALFGAYPFNLAAGWLYHGGFSIAGQTDKGYKLHKPAMSVKHEAPSGLAGQTVHYLESSIYFTPSTIDFVYEPYETVVNGVADNMQDPIIRAQYKARVITKGADGKPKVSWTSRYAVTPKRRLRKAEFLKLAGISMEEVMWKCRHTYNIVPVKGETHITSIAMDIDKPSSTSLNSTVYINGIDANTFNYKSLINSFGKTYDGYMHIYRLMNGARIGGTTDNVYGSTLNIPLVPGADSTINLELGAVNAYNIASKTLTFNADLVEEASLIAYMEFLPANGKNENCGKEISLETGIEKLF